jgi:hypothetical protein
MTAHPYLKPGLKMHPLRFHGRVHRYRDKITLLQWEDNIRMDLRKVWTGFIWLRIGASDRLL